MPRALLLCGAFLAVALAALGDSPGKTVAALKAAAAPNENPNVKKLCDCIACIEDATIKQQATDDKDKLKIFSKDDADAKACGESSSYHESFVTPGAVGGGLASKAKVRHGDTGFELSEICDPNALLCKATVMEELIHATQGYVWGDPGNIYTPQGEYTPKETWNKAALLYKANHWYNELEAKAKVLGALAAHSTSGTDANTAAQKKYKTEAGEMLYGLCLFVEKAKTKGATAAEVAAFVTCKTNATNAGIVPVKIGRK